MIFKRDYLQCIIDELQEDIDNNTNLHTPFVQECNTLTYICNVPVDNKFLRDVENKKKLIKYLKAINTGRVSDDFIYFDQTCNGYFLGELDVLLNKNKTEYVHLIMNISCINMYNKFKNSSGEFFQLDSMETLFNPEYFSLLNTTFDNTFRIFDIVKIKSQVNHIILTTVENSIEEIIRNKLEVGKLTLLKSNNVLVLIMKKGKDEYSLYLCTPSGLQILSMSTLMNII